MKLFYKNETETHTIYKILFIKLKFRKKVEIRLNKSEIKNIIKNLDINKKNYLYLDWDFGKYVFDEMLNKKYKNINLVKFSLFNLLNVSNRFELWDLWKENKIQIEKSIVKTFKNKNISGLLVTQDWAPCFDDWVKMFAQMNIPTICIIHEGVFQDEKLYYDSKSPISDKVLTWGEQTKKIFTDRGYPEEKVYCIGSIKLNSYKNFRPSISREDFFKIAKLDSKKKTILYCCQLCDFQWGDQNFALQKQRDMLDDLIQIAEEKKYNIIIRNAPSGPKKILPLKFTNKYKNNSLVFIDGFDIDNSLKSTYITAPNDSIYYSDIIIGMNTTMQLEASVLNKPALVAKYFEYDDKWHRELGLPVCKTKDELLNAIEKYIDLKEGLISQEAKQKFYSNYGYYPEKDFNPLKNIEEILT